MRLQPAFHFFLDADLAGGGIGCDDSPISALFASHARMILRAFSYAALASEMLS